METFEEQYQAATARAQERLRTEPHIEKAHYDPGLDRVIISLSNHAWFAFRPEDAQGLEGATTEQLKQIEIAPSTFGFYFPLLDAHFDITALLQGRFGTIKWMAQRVPAGSSSVRSKAKPTPTHGKRNVGVRRKAAAIQ